MEHGLNFATVAVAALAVVGWSLVSRRAERWNVSGAMALTLVGLLVANGPLAVVDLHIGAEGIRVLAEITLAVVLFGDAAGIDTSALRRDAGAPARLLLIGLPLTMATGVLAARLLFPGLSWWLCAVLAASVAPTDAALGAPIIDDERVPTRIRRLLNVESGLNDGIVTPFVKFFLVAATVGTAAEHGSEGGALRELALGLLAGVLVGALGALLMAAAARVGSMATAQAPLGVVALALVAYAGAVETGGNGFVAAFVAGLAFGAATPDRRTAPLSFTHQTGALLSHVVWFVFGAVLVPVLADAGWRDLLFAVLALTVVRMLPVAVALLGTGSDRATVGVIGWFGPRGLASVVFAVLAFEDLDPADGRAVTVAITMTVLASVVLHGVSAAPVAARYGAGHRDGAPTP